MRTPSMAMVVQVPAWSKLEVFAQVSPAYAVRHVPRAATEAAAALQTTSSLPEVPARHVPRILTNPSQDHTIPNVLCAQHIRRAQLWGRVLFQLANVLQALQVLFGMMKTPVWTWMSAPSAYTIATPMPSA